MSGTIRQIDDHLDHELTDEGFNELSDWLRADSAHVDQFVSEWLIHSLLYDWASEHRVQTTALSHAAADDDGAWAFNEHADPQPEGTKRPEYLATGISGLLARPWRLAAWSVAVLLLLALGWGVLGKIAPRSQAAAMLTQSTGCRWENADASILDGALLQRGQELRLVEGRAHVMFLSGARVILIAPAVLRIDSESAATLASGTVAARVPTQAVGFRIDTRPARFVDLGTEFSVRLLPQDGFELQVFDGLVELRLQGAFAQSDDGALRISEGTAVKFDGIERQVESVPYDEHQRIEMP